MSTIDDQALEWVLRQSGRDLDAASRAALDTWLAADIRHQGAYARALAINSALDHARVQEALRPGRERLEQEWAGVARRPWHARRAVLALGGIAACAAAFTIALILPPLADNGVLTTAKGEFRKVPLNDKSVASINSASQVEVKLTDSTREITLNRGEAWFEVAKDKVKPFIVEAGQVQVRAVGTAFGVRRFSDGAEVLVTEGVVEVWARDGSAGKRLVRAGERAFVPNRATDIVVARQPNEIARKLAWKEGKVVFNNQTLSEAVADFNRYSLKKIVIVDPRLNNKTLVGQYQIDAPELFARDISTFLDVPIQITADRILIGGGKPIDGRAGAEGGKAG